MSFHLRPSFQSVPVVPVAAPNMAADPKAYYVPSNAPRPITQAGTPPPVPQTITPRHSLHQRMPTNSSMGLDSALEGLDTMDFSQNNNRITSDISTLDCESVKADPHFNPAVEELPFVPPLDIAIPVNLSHLATQQQQYINTRRSSFNNNSNSNDAILMLPLELTRITSAQSRLEMSQASAHPKQKSFSHKMAIKLALDNGGVLPPAYHEDSVVLDQSLQDYANGAGAVTYDDNNSQLSYYTSPTDLYTSDDSEPIVQAESKKGMVKRELKKIMFRFQRTSKILTKVGKNIAEPMEGVVKEETMKEDYESFGSERGFC